MAILSIRCKPDNFEVFVRILQNVNLSLNQALPLTQKDSFIHMHGLSVYVKEELPFARHLSLENSVDSYLSFRLVLLQFAVSASTEFLSNSKWGVLPFHHIAYDYSHANWVSLCDHLISLNSVFLLLLVNFVSGFRLELM